MKKSLLGVVVALAIVGGATALLRPIDVDFRIGRGAAPITGNLSVSPSEAQAQTAEEGLESLRSQSRAFVKISKTVLPSVVSIVSEREVRMTGIPGHEGLGGDFFGRFFEMPQRVPQQGSGSGVIVSADGYILTNNHVVAEAERITVTFHDGRALPGKLVGRDPQSDIAVIRVEAKDLTPARIGDSSKLEVGEWVLAVGNPFQLKSTVTAGIVSAVGRSNIGLADYEDFIQTDAAINPGNSGGALVNLDGELVGVNTAIATRNGGNQGVGFAIPINMAHQIMGDLVANGRVVRGYLGVQLQRLTEETAEIFGLERPQGALVGQVTDDSPASRAGMKQGDVIVAIDGVDVKGVDDLRLRVVEKEPGTQVRLTVVRDKQRREITARLAELEPRDDARAKAPGDDDSDRSRDLGMTIEDLTARARRSLDLSESVDGVLVTEVDPLKPAGRAGLQRGDVITKIGSEPVLSIRALKRAVAQAPKGKPVLMLVRRGENEIFLGVRIPE